MEKRVEFFKQNGIWYADLPENTLEENEMLAGSDEFLEKVTGDCNRVALDLSTEPVIPYLVKMKLETHDEIGGDYLLSGPLIEAEEQEGMSMPVTAWICNATHSVFGEHPDEIYITHIYKM